MGIYELIDAAGARGRAVRIGPARGVASGEFRSVDPEFDAIETLYGVGYRYRET